MRYMHIYILMMMMLMMMMMMMMMMISICCSNMYTRFSEEADYQEPYSVGFKQARQLLSLVMDQRMVAFNLENQAHLKGFGLNFHRPCQEVQGVHFAVRVPRALDYDLQV